MMREQADLVIIGGGPAGLSAAREAARGGLKKIVVLEREREAGGTPRHCGHTGFGWRDFRRIWSGPEYARRLLEAAAGADVRGGHAALALGSRGIVEVSGPSGLYSLQAKRVLVATGIYEKPYGARLVNGTRPFGTFTTGVLQRFVYLEGRLPCLRPVVIGSGLIAYSTIWTLRHLGARPAALVESAKRPATSPFLRLAARWIYGVPTLLATELCEVAGDARVEGVVVSDGATRRTLACDAVIFSGEWMPETALLRAAGIPMDAKSKGPQVDASFRTGDPFVFAAGNALHSARSAAACAMEGRRAARAIVTELRLELPAANGSAT